MEKNSPQELLSIAFDLIEHTGTNLFLTGKAGTGKTTFLKNLQKNSFKRMVIVAPTGVAAINAGGSTIHSFFQLAFGPFVPGDNIKRDEKIYALRAEKKKLIRSLDLLVIDEISMVRADLLDHIDYVLRKNRRDQRPFGGLQLLLIGDMQQLPPVIKDEEWNVLREFYNSAYFFNSIALQKTNYACIELKHIFRQNDEKFIDILNGIRCQKMKPEHITTLNSRYLPEFNPPEEENYIRLTTHNNQAKNINEKKLAELNGIAFTYKATITGIFPDKSYPTEEVLTLKVGAQVMFVKNDASPEKRYYNGKIGRIVSLTDTSVTVNIDNGSENITVEAEKWSNTRYALDNKTNEITEVEDGSFSQIPLRLAWAITIHKSQGLTFERVIVDAGAAFAHGQVYVALSRCKSIEGLVLSTQISQSSLKSDYEISRFNEESQRKEPKPDDITRMHAEYYLSMLYYLLNFNELRNALSNVHRIIDEFFFKLYPEALKAYELATTELETKITSVAHKFSHQIASMNIYTLEKDEKLHERIKNGASYFHENLNAILKKIGGYNIESDNKEDMKRLERAMTVLAEEFSLKLALLKSAMTNGFSIESQAKAKADATAGAKDRSTKKTNKSNNDVKYPLIHDEIKKWRKEKSEELGEPAFTVLKQTSLIEISNNPPLDVKDLKHIAGIGDKTIEKYGKELIEIVANAMRKMAENGHTNIDDDDENSDTTQVDNKKTEKTKSHIKTLELFNEGKSIKEIAEERGLSASTIETHICKLIEDGMILDKNIIPAEKYNTIEDILLHNPSIKMSEMKEQLSDDYSWSEIKMTVAFFKQNNKTN